jgi:hypothetical protein
MSDTTKLLPEIRDAYEALGLRPIRRHFYIHDQGGDFACPLVALALHRGVTDRDDPDLARDDGFNLAVEWAAQQFGESWVIGFLDGFDGDPQNHVDPAYLSGCRLGALAAEQLGVGG